MMHVGRFSAILIILVVLSCGSSDPSSPGGAPPAHGGSEYPQRGVHHGGSFLSWDAERIAEAARGTIMISPIEFWFSPEAQDFIAELKGHNPDIVIIGYQLVMGVPMRWADTTVVSRLLPYAFEYYETVSDDWAYTTTGDTLMLWPDLVFLNPIDGSAIDRALIHELVGLIEKYQALSGGVIDGIMHDYFMDSPYLSPSVRERVTGEIDLDGDGAIFADDTAERDLFIIYQKEYAREISRRLGPNFIQIGNGLLHHADAEMASLLNGIFYEDFPQCRTWSTDRDGLLKLLDHHVEGYLTKARGRTWSIVMNERGGGANIFSLVASMLAGCMYAELHGKNLFTGWTLDIRGGYPTGDVIREGPMDSLTVRRPFQYGEARMTFAPTGARREVVFECTHGACE
jgi:hypothetical protein